jgi:fructose-1,6-bisphosphatase I
VQAWTSILPTTRRRTHHVTVVHNNGLGSTTPAVVTPTTTAPVDGTYYSILEAAVLQNNNNNNNNNSSTRRRSAVTLTRYLDQRVKQNPELRDLETLLLAIQMACKTISNLVNRAGLVWDPTTTTTTTTTRPTAPTRGATVTTPTTTTPTTTTTASFTDGRFYSMKRLDQLSTLVLKNALKYTGNVQVVVAAARNNSEVADHQPGVLIAKLKQRTTTVTDNSHSMDHNNNNNSSSSHFVNTNSNNNNNSISYVACLDPLDGSGNADASICTGTIFGVFEQLPETTSSTAKSKTTTSGETNATATDTVRTQHQLLVESVLQPAKNMRAAGYCLYSSATVLVFTLGDSVQGFTLDPQINEFVLTHPNWTIPARGNVYSCNEGNSEGWDAGFRRYVRDIKTGAGQTGERYAHRYVGSMVGDIHRTLLYGGIFAYPADTQSHPAGNLQLLYKTAPMAFVMHHARGRAIDGRTGSLLNVRPTRVHEKTPCFLGSPEDVAELETYLGTKTIQ